MTFQKIDIDTQNKHVNCHCDISPFEVLSMIIQELSQAKKGSAVARSPASVATAKTPVCLMGDSRMQLLALTQRRWIAVHATDG